jgi:hypothetical protein
MIRHAIDGAGALVEVGQVAAVFDDALLHVFHPGTGRVVIPRRVSPGCISLWGVAQRSRRAPTERCGRDYRRGSKAELRE